MTNKHIVITRKGGPEVLELIEGEVREPEPGQVRVRIQATGVAFADVLMRYGVYPGTPKPPFTPGYDIAGTIDKLGAGVTGFEVGQPVVALTVRGGYAEFICLPADELVAAPAGLDPAESASIVLNYVTAYQLLHRFAEAKRGERVLVHGAAGGVGTALLQLGQLAGLEMYGTASKAKHPVVADAGAAPIDYRAESFRERLAELAPGGVDVVFDGVGGANFWHSYRSLRAGGRLVAYGVQAAIHGSRASIPTLAASMTLLGLLRAIPDGRRARFYSVADEKRKHPDEFRKDLGEVLRLLADGAIRPVIAQRLPLAEASRAHELIENARVAGKIVLVCNGTDAAATTAGV